MLYLLPACTALLQMAVGIQLNGRVSDDEGKPINGAIVVVSTCKPRSGPSTICPSCYLDCKKRATTDAEGNFELRDLSGDLLFSLAIGAPGSRGTITEHIDPRDARPLEIGLDKPVVDDGSPLGILRGSVRSLDGQPIPGAVLQLRRVQRGNRVSGSDPSVTPVTITNEQGRFEASVGPDVVMVAFRAMAAGFAPLELEWRSVDREEIEFQLGRGASLTGQLRHAGKPLAGIRLGIVQTERSVGNIVTPELLSTDEEGYFRFDQLPPDRDYAIYTDLDQESSAALPVSLVSLPAHGKIADLGVLETQPAGSFVINLQTADDSPLPEEGVVYVGRDKAWHPAVLKFKSGGKSRVTVSVPSVGQELVEVTIRAHGFEVQRVTPQRSPGLNREYGFRTNEVRQVDFVLAQ